MDDYDHLIRRTDLDTTIYSFMTNSVYALLTVHKVTMPLNNEAKLV